MSLDVPRTLTVLILGGYGTFGGRLATLLADEPRLTLLVAGRSQARAQPFCRALGGRARAVPVALDRADLAAHLPALAPDLVVDATGPFQAYGPEPYAVVRACLAHRVPYLDLADGTEFVDGIARFDEQASDSQVFVLSGMSSFPVLTAAVVDALAHDLAQVEAVTGGIAPSPYAGVGANVIRAIAGYAGQPLSLRRYGRDVTAHALTESRNITIAPPGRVPLRTTRFSLVDVPDLRVLPRRYPGLREVWMGAGPVPEILHRALNALSWLVRWRLLPSLAVLAPLIDRVINRVRWGEDRGGMIVEVCGRDAAGAVATRTWHLVAEGRDGPMIPSMAAEAIVRRLLDGDPPPPGARSGDGELSLKDYDALFARRSIVTGRRGSEHDDPRLPPYRRLLGPAWDGLAPAVRALHDSTPDGGTRLYRGRARVTRGPGWRAALAARLFGFPPAGEDVPVTVQIAPEGAGETWTRDFAGHRFASTQSEGSGRWARLLCERFGPVRVGTALVVEGGNLVYVLRRWSLFGLPMPRALGPRGGAVEREEDGRFRFDVTIAHPLADPIVTYRGWLEPAAQEDAPDRAAG